MAELISNELCIFLLCTSSETGGIHLSLLAKVICAITGKSAELHRTKNLVHFSGGEKVLAFLLDNLLGSLSWPEPHRSLYQYYVLPIWVDWTCPCFILNQARRRRKV